MDEQQLAARLLALREKAVKPEDITTDNLEDSLNFDSKHIERFEAERELHKTQIKQNKELLEDYQAEIEQLKRTIQIEEALKKTTRDWECSYNGRKGCDNSSTKRRITKYRIKIKKENRKKFIKKVGVFFKRDLLAFTHIINNSVNNI